MNSCAYLAYLRSSSSLSLRKTSLTIEMASASASMLFMGDNKAVATLSQGYSFCTSPHSPLPVAPRTAKRIRPMTPVLVVAQTITRRLVATIWVIQMWGVWCYTALCSVATLSQMVIRRPVGINGISVTGCV